MRESTAPSVPVLTARLTLRPLAAADRDALLAYRSDPDTCRYLPFSPQTGADVERYIATRGSRTVLDAEDSSVSLAVVETATGVLAGDVILFMRSRAEESVEVGWVFDPRYRGRGFATEAAAALLSIAFDEVRAHRVVARMDPANVASARVAARLGMRREALLIENEHVKGRWCDTLLFAMLEREWRGLHR